ncbi:hypothetical protein Tco_1443745 [Tanacetum coccineum]
MSNPIKQSGFNKHNINANIDVKNNDKQSSASFSSRGFTFEQMKKLLSLINDTLSRCVHANMTDSKMYVGFDEDRCYIHDLKKEKVSGTRSEPGGLYMFDVQSNNSVGKSNIVMCFNVSKLLWRNRLDHPVCQKAKQTRDHFPMSDYKSRGLDELVHLDLWGPYRVPSKEEFNYFLYRGR